jgi:hypothetical protein
MALALGAELDAVDALGRTQRVVVVVDQHGG